MKFFIHPRKLCLIWNTENKYFQIIILTWNELEFMELLIIELLLDEMNMK